MGSPAYVALWLDRFVSATADWTEEEVGVYLRLLLYQAQHGAIPDDPARRARIVRMPRETFERIWTELLADKFEGAEGGLVNARMARERELALAHSERQSARAKTRWAGRKKAEETEESGTSASNSGCHGTATAQAAALPRDMPRHCRGNATQTQTQRIEPPPSPPGGRGALEGEEGELEHLLESFGELHLAQTGRQYQATKAEERAGREILGLAVPHGGLREALSRARRMFASSDPWERANASLRTLCARWAKFGELVVGQPEPKPWGHLRPETWLAQAVDQHRAALSAGDEVRVRRARWEVYERARLTNLPEPELPSRELSAEEVARMARFFPRLAAEA